jgi:hypothetical protein
MQKRHHQKLALSMMTFGNSYGRVHRKQAAAGLAMRKSEAFALEPLALHLAGAADGLSRLASAALRGLLEMATELHFTEDALALHFLLQRLERLIDIVVANQNLHLAAFSCSLALPDNRGAKRVPV